jgi:hypothetical protein
MSVQPVLQAPFAVVITQRLIALLTVEKQKCTSREDEYLVAMRLLAGLGTFLWAPLVKLVCLKG